MTKAALYGNEVRLASRRVAAESNKILDARLVHAVEKNVNLFLRLADAGQVGHGQQGSFSLDRCDYLLGETLSGAAGTVGDGDEVGIEDGESIDGPEDGGNAFPGLGGIELEGEGTFPPQYIGYLDVGPPLGALWKHGLYFSIDRGGP